MFCKRAVDSIYTRSDENDGDEKPVPILKVSGEWLYLNWFVADRDAAWNCALDVEAWLRVRHAGNGTINQGRAVKLELDMCTITQLETRPLTRDLKLITSLTSTIKRCS